MEYIIKAFSPSLNETQRELILEGSQPNNEQLAWQWANSFAARLTRQGLATDWVAQIEAVGDSHYRTL